MADIAPFCNVTTAPPVANPTSPTGFRLIPPGTPLDQVINALNHNFDPRTQQNAFDRLLKNDIDRPAGTKTGGVLVKPSQIRKAAQDEISKLDFREVAIVRKKMKVENPKDRNMWIVDDRVVNLFMTDRRTGAKWVFRDPLAEKGIAAGSEETTVSA